MSTGFAVNCKVKKIKQKDAVNSSDIKVFKKAAQKILVAVAERLLERTPLDSLLLQFSSVFDSQNQLQISKSKTIVLLKILLTNIISLNILPSTRYNQP